MSRHFFDNAAPQQAGRGSASPQPPYDPAITRYLEATGIGAGWRCAWRWAAARRRVGPSGRVPSRESIPGPSPCSRHSSRRPDHIGSSPSASPIADRPRPGSGAAAFA